MTDKAKHTPGPWDVMWQSAADDGSPSGERPPLVFQPEGAFHIANVGGGSQRNRVANARLIAAAPELLEAACSFLRYIRNNGGSVAYTQHAQVAAAIEKATGCEVAVGAIG